MKEIKQLIDMSKYAGERFDLVQAGGGNTSVKLNDGSMLIKASGVLLSELGINTGYSRVLTQKVVDVVNSPIVLQSQDKRERETLANSLVNEATLDKANRPSIETLFHSLLQKYVLHTHPIVVNMITARKNWKEVLDSLFPDAVKVGYYTPGIDLVIPMKKELDEYDERHHKLPNLIFLQNHGLIVSSDHFSDIAELNESVLQKIETFLDIPSSEYKLTTAISKLLRHADPEHHMIAFLSEDSVVNKMDRSLFFKRPFTPDILVFCGMEPLKIDSLTDPEPVIAYTKKCHGLPRIIIFKDHIFCIALNVKKAREVEEVLKFHLTVLSLNQETEVNFLSGDELIYLSNWEAEKYRQNI